MTRYAAALLALVVVHAAARAADEIDYAADLPRIPQTPAAAARDTMRVAPGFRLDLVAAEPMLASPVAIAWDEDGRLFVAEMRGYSEDRGERLGRIRLLVDEDDDGRYDRASVFADGFAWPTAVCCWDGGLFVGDAPDVFYVRDDDGDGVADTRRRVLTGFGTDNVQGLFNSFAYELDNRIHAAGSSSGGEVRRVNAADEPEGEPVSIRGRDVSFDPRTLEVRPETGGVQHGRSCDDWGATYVCHNSDHAVRCMIDDRFLARNPSFTPPSPKASIAVEGPQAEVFRVSPVEPWRVLRTRLRASGIVPGIVEGGGRPAGYFTSATGITVVRGDRCGDDLAGMLVVGDVGSNVVHRKRLLPDGPGVRAERVDVGSELVASTDVWFRPVQFACGPDGCLTIIDMQREVIEHPASLPPPIKRHLDLTSGRDTGRLWRLAPEPHVHRPAPRLSRASTAELVALLSHPNGWHRATAQRLLVGRGGTDAVAALESLATDAAAVPLGRLHALHTLDGLGSLSPEPLIACLAARESGLRAAAAGLAERLPSAEPLADALCRLADDPDVGVRFRLALVAGGLDATRRLPLLARLLEQDGGDPWCRFAAFTALDGGAGRVVRDWLADPTTLDDAAARAALPGLVAQVARSGDAGEIAAIVAAVAEVATDPARTAAATDVIVPLRAALAAGDPTADRTAEVIATLVARHRRVAANPEADGSARVAAVRGLAIGRPDEVADDLAALVTGDTPEAVAGMAVDVLAGLPGPRPAEIVLAAWDGLSEPLHGRALALLVRDAGRATALLEAIASGRIPPATLDVATTAALHGFPDADVRRRTAEVLGPPPAARRDELVAAYRAALPADGRREAGQAIFATHCAACHRVEGVGRETGPNLAAMQARGAEAILLAILDPNREVQPQFVAHTAVTASGRVLSGIKTAESETSVTLRTADGVEETFARDELDACTATGRSLMPEGFERTIDPRAMADLLAYLLSAR